MDALALLRFLNLGMICFWDSDEMNRQIIHPRLIERECGGWLALSPFDAQIRIGVTANTEEAARHEFARSIARWEEILADGHTTDDLGHPAPN